MCGRYALHNHPTIIALQFWLKEYSQEIKPRYNIAPGTQVLAVLEEAGLPRSAEMLKWGLVPFWAKDPKIGYKMSNARAETVDEKPAYRSAFKARRCILPASGFYEWKSTGARKQPYFICPSGKGLFGFAGLYEHWKGGNDEIHSCAIITTEANSLMRTIHDRMPVILHEEDYARWLDPGNQNVSEMRALLKPFDSGLMRAYPVSTRVNNARNDGAELLEPVESS